MLPSDPIRSASDSISPGFLIASPRLDGTPFERAVVVMVHHDHEGAMGFIINKPLDLDFGSLIESVNDEIARQILPECFEMPVHFGGPVRVEQLWLIFQRELAASEKAVDRELLRQVQLPDDGALTFCEGWFLAAHGEIIEGFALGHQHGSYRPMIGYSGWGPGQLESEIEEGSWLLLDFDGDFLLDSLPSVHWDDALERLGVDPTAFLMMGKSGMA